MDKVIYNKLVGEKNGEYYFCDYIFDDGKGFKGATATILVPVSKEEYDERTSLEGAKERFEDLWRETVKDGGTEDSLEDWCQSIIDTDGDDAFFDFSGCNLWEQLRDKFPEDEYPVFECIGGGRSFSKENDFDRVFDQELLKKIQEVEN